MANVLLGVTGSVAAIYTPNLYEDLRAAGHQVKIVATRAALYFFDPLHIEPTILQSRAQRNPDVVCLDEDEWPGRDTGQRYERGDKVIHIELRRWADVFLIAPLDANTLAKLACGLADNYLTCVWRAWDRSRLVVLAPAMNTLMWEHPLTLRHFRQLAMDAGAEPPADLDLDALLDWINVNCRALRVVPPISKKLACEDVGIGAMAERTEIITTVGRALAIS
ncbi:MAG: phosphopantothenoylcysteine decarboxylase [Gemmataceae bacterium]|nr:phosphopantothenoylcysteine decarboxylase [Gemmataceae bacterium]MCI0739245.1 phosphopantothenoylcysteine decarboxylase [Gemmataceae bacterium]